MEKDNSTASHIPQEGNGCEEKEMDFEEVIDANPNELDFDEMIDKLLEEE